MNEAAAKARREAAIYDKINLAINQTIYRDVAIYLNFGYCALEGVPIHGAFTDPEVVTSDSMRLVIELIGDTPLEGRYVVDVGCGRGGTLEVIRQLYAPAFTLGIDLSREAVAFCSRRYPLATAAFKEGDAQALPLPDASADVIINLESAVHYPDVNAFYRGVFRVLKPGGHFQYGDLIPMATLNQRLDFLRSLGFVVNRVVDATPGVLASCEKNGPRRLRTFMELCASARLESDLGVENLEQFIGDWFAVPGSNSYNRLRQGEEGYLLLKLAKPALPASSEGDASARNRHAIAIDRRNPAEHELALTHPSSADTRDGSGCRADPTPARQS